MLPSQMQAVNPILILLFIPLFSYVIYPLRGQILRGDAASQSRHRTVAGDRRIHDLVARPSQSIDRGETPHFSWQILAYVIMTAAEVMVSITVLEFSYTQAPRKMKSFVMGVFLFFSMTLGNLFTAQVNEYICRPKGGRQHGSGRCQLLLVLHGRHGGRPR